MLKFKTIRYKNFLSSGNVFTEIKLDKSPNTLIVGQNGSGKSTFMDAIVFACYGKPYRKVRKGQLVNSINKGDCVVELELEAYKNEYKIVRGIKPDIFEIYKNGVQLNQTASIRDYQDILEKNILRMNMKSFTQIVILGSSAFVPFMQLPTPVRREVIEDLLDIKVFSAMSSLLKDRQNKARTDIALATKDIESHITLIEAHKTNLEYAIRSRDENIAGIQDKIKEREKRIAEWEIKIDKTNEKVATLLPECGKHKPLSKKIDSILKTRKELLGKITKSNKAIEFFEQNDHCPTCTQPIDDGIKNTKITKRKESIEKVEKGLIDLEKIEKETKEEYDAITALIEEVSLMQKDIGTMQNAQRLATHELKFLNESMEKIKEADDSDIEGKIEQLTGELSGFEAIKEKLLKEQEVNTIGSIILRDGGIKSKVVKQYIPVMNQLVNKYLAAMDFFVKFELDENFEEKILSRHRDEFSYASFSEGEKQRIDIALLFTWRTIARLKNSSNTNLLILDEIFDASLDQMGIEYILEILNNSSEETNTFVISHRGDQLQDKFRSSIRFEKQSNYSRIV